MPALPTPRIVRDHDLQPASGWMSRVVVIWEEDDATLNDPDAEKAYQAWDRLFCGPYSNFYAWSRRETVATFDAGDVGYELCRGGHVLISGIDGHQIGVLAKLKET